MARSKAAPACGCPVAAFQKMISGKYKLRIVWDLKDGPLRYGEIRTGLLRGSDGSAEIAPRVLNSIRLNLKAVMLFLFAGEMIASSDGLAYRIALLRRHMGMDVIIPYVLWVALLLFLVDVAMRRTNRLLHPWFRES